MNIEEILENCKNSNSYESLPPIVSNGIESWINIETDKRDKTITISYNECLERVGDRKHKSPELIKKETITIPVEMLSWFSPRLEGIRNNFGLENNFEKYSK